MQQTDRISELSQISKTLSACPVSAPYTVPAGYFNTLTDIILQRIRATDAPTLLEETEALSPLLSRISKQMPYALPETYFQELTAVPVAGGPDKIEDTEYTTSLSPLLLSLHNKETYRLPAHYFEQLPQAILEKVGSGTKARVIPVSFGSKIARYAVAASVAAVMIISGWFLLNRQQPVSLAATKEPAGIKDVSNKELQDYIDQNTVILPDKVAVVSTEIQAEDVKTMLAGVPDAELRQYLDQQPDLKDPASANFN